MAGRIRKAILRGHYHPGQHLSQIRLAEEYDVSKVPIREALKQLDAEGLLLHDHNRGYFVARVSRDEARQLYRMRRWLESELLRSVRWPDSAETVALRAQLAVISVPIERGMRDNWLEALSTLRQMIFELSPEHILLREAMRLWTLTDRFRALLPDSKAATGEGALVDALERQDRVALLAAHDADRTRIELLLDEVLDALPNYWTD
jgi:DNA-binding GntR family transcriptional regulator